MNKLTQFVALAGLSWSFAFIACGSEFGGPDPEGTAGAPGTPGVAGAPSTGGASMATAGAPSNGGATPVTAGAPNTGATSGSASSGGCNVGFSKPSRAAFAGVAVAIAAGLARRRRRRLA